MIKLTRKERQLCEFLESGYLARDVYGRVFWFEKEPVRGPHIWDPSPKDMLCKTINIDAINPCLFAFILCEDEEPWGVEGMLK